MIENEYFLTYWDNGVWRCKFYSLEQAYKFICNNGIIHFDLIDRMGVVYNAIF